MSYHSFGLGGHRKHLDHPVSGLQLPLHNVRGWTGPGLGHEQNEQDAGQMFQPSYEIAGNK